MPLGQTKPNARRSPQQGSLVARVLAGAWRESASAPDLSEAQLTDVTRLLYASGSAALGWWRLRNSKLAESDSGKLLRDAYRRSRLNALVHEREIEYVVSLLRAVEVEPILVKGWAIARHYPDRALRPYGDIDLCVRPDQFGRAKAALKCLENIEGHYVDPHNGFGKFAGGQKWHGRPAREGAQHSSLRKRKSSATKHGQDAHATFLWDEFFDRSQLVDLGKGKVRVLSPEDHLRVLCVHLLRSGAWRPLWLCDIALAVESRSADFDWPRCLGSDPLLSDWIACTIGLAHHLLDLDVSDTPVAQRAKNLPRWLVPAVLRQWGRSRNPDAAGMALPALARTLAEPRELFCQIYARWDQPVRATAELNGKFSNWRRLPYQIGELILHTPEVPRQLGSMLRDGFRRAVAVKFSPGFQGGDAASKVGQN